MSLDAQREGTHMIRGKGSSVVIEWASLSSKGKLKNGEHKTKNEI